MTTSPEHSDETRQEQYVLDTESGAEMARLMRQDQLITQGMGGIFPEQKNLEGVRQVLDLACGPGGWVFDTAFTYPHMQVMGVDISEKMVVYAKAQARVQGLANASFEVMNILQPLSFADASFDLVNERFIVGFMQQKRWPQLVDEGLRILRPGGILRFTEVEVGFVNKPTFEKALWLILQAMQRNGLGFSPHGLHFSIFPMLPRFFRDAGVQEVSRMSHVIEFSTGTEAHDGFYYDFANAFLAVEPFLERSGLVTLEEWRTLSQRALAEMFEDDFCAVWVLLTVWGRKAGNP